MGRSRWIAHVVLTLVLAGAVVTAGCGNRAPATGGGAQGAGGVAQGAGGAVSKTVKKLEIAYFLPPVIPSAKNLQWMAEEITKRSGGAIQATFHGATISTKELEIVDMVKTGTIQVGTTGGAATTVFPELSVFLLPYLFRDYDHAYKVLNGDIGREYAKLIEDKYGLHVLFFYDYGFRQFWNTKRPITKPDDLKGLKMRVQQGQVFVDTVNGLGASAVPMSWSEVIPAVQQGVVDGADLPVVNIDALKVYEVAKYASMTSHNFGPAVAVVNKAFWSGLSDEERKLIEELASEAQRRTIEATSGADAKARELLEPKGMQVNFPDLEPFRKVAQEKVWPKYREQYGQVIDRITQVR